MNNEVTEAISQWAVIGSDNDCWEYKLKDIVRNGTKRLTYGRVLHEGKKVRAHRAAYMLAFGPIPSGFYVCHRCDNPLCLNPSHLFVGTPQDNVSDKMAKGRHVTLVGQMNGRATITDAQVDEIRRRVRAGELQRVLAAEFGVSQALISMIHTQKTRAQGSSRRRNKEKEDGA